MKLKEAFEYLCNNHKNLLESNAKILGIAYTPKDEAEFQIIELTIDTESNDGHDCYYSASLEGSNLFSYDGIEDQIGNENLDELIEEMPAFATEIQYKIYHNKDDHYGLCAEYALRTIFPELPNPDDLDDHHQLAQFKKDAIARITLSNQA